MMGLIVPSLSDTFQSYFDRRKSLYDTTFRDAPAELLQGNRSQAVANGIEELFRCEAGSVIWCYSVVAVNLTAAAITINVYLAPIGSTPTSNDRVYTASVPASGHLAIFSPCCPAGYIYFVESTIVDCIWDYNVMKYPVGKPYDPIYYFQLPANTNTVIYTQRSQSIGTRLRVPLIGSFGYHFLPFNTTGAGIVYSISRRGTDGVIQQLCKLTVSANNFQIIPSAILGFLFPGDELIMNPTTAGLNITSLWDNGS